MNYFAKFLPVEGDIRARKDVPVFVDGKLTFLQLNTSEKMLAFTELEGYKNNLYKPAKLFLCSKDVQVGDKFSCDDRVGVTCKSESYGVLYIEEDGQSFDKDKAYKVIGEINPEAMWIKEGDEFSRDELEFDLIDRKFPTENNIAISDEEYDKIKKVHLVERADRYKIEIRVKGPCGHFH